MKKRLLILGSTGSIGTQTLEVVDQFPELFSVSILAAKSNVELLAEQAEKYKPHTVVIADESKLEALKSKISDPNIKIYCGNEAICDLAQSDEVDIVVAAIVGVAGLHATLSAVKSGKTIALANKESLVVAGEIIINSAKENNAKILPVDSEHSAIFQCLVGEDVNHIDKIILTASGGPFLGKKTNFLVNVKKSHALEHPNWTMGEKITIDSATLMNKGLEMIEAKHLFGLQNDQIEVLIHPQSIIHSFVSFNDGSIKAQLGLPDMKLPIQYALCYPQRLKNDNPKLSFKNYESLTFEEPDYRTFRNLMLAKNAMFTGGNAPAILNAVNEEVVYSFLDNKIGFLDMSDIIEEAMNNQEIIPQPSLDDLLNSDKESRIKAREAISKLQ